MKKHFVRIGATVLGLVACAAGAKAQVVDQVIVNVPYEFVVAGKTLPPGTYRVNRVSDSIRTSLLLSSFENRVSVVVVSREVEDSREDKPNLTFQEIGGQHFLSKIETAEHAFTFPVSQSPALEAATKSHQGSRGSVASGTN